MPYVGRTFGVGVLKALAYAMKRCLGSHAWVFEVQPSLIGCACDATLSQLHPSPTGAYPILTFGHTLVHTPHSPLQAVWW